MRIWTVMTIKACIPVVPIRCNILKYNSKLKLFLGREPVNGFPLRLERPQNNNGVATDLFCTGVIGHPDS